MIQVGIVGGTGYTGVELLRLLSVHPEVELAVITSRAEAGRSVCDIFPNLRGAVSLKFSEPDLAALQACHLVFFATPNGTAMTMAEDLLRSGVKVIDLAADFRLRDPDLWEKWYKQPHSATALLAEAVYGLPELYREKIKKARLVANPGCYPTATLLGFAPLIRSGCVDLSWLISDAKSGTSGAGRKGEISMLLSEASESFKAYGVSGHRHWPEIHQELQVLADHQEVGLTFTPHLTPMIRGIHATLYAQFTQSTDLQSFYETFYQHEPFIDVLPPGSHPETRTTRGTNLCRIAVHHPPVGNNTVVILSVIDNLVKGAAGQAVQNMNIMFGFEETLGLPRIALIP